MTAPGPKRSLPFWVFLLAFCALILGLDAVFVWVAVEYPVESVEGSND